ncbi:MAG: hypothetical protein AB8H80_02430 [Planctomycetota bacterium]
MPSCQAVTSLALFVGLTACAGGAHAEPFDGVRVHHAAAGDRPAFEELRGAFARANAGYDLAWHAQCRELAAADRDRVVFVQGPAERTAEPTVGDALIVRAGESWHAPDAQPLDLVAFTLPQPVPKELPPIVRPDWDPNITDTPGGCATEGDAYRRILLTWNPEVGPYVLHQLNAHRVRITNSFSHYHPVEGGFDEFYLVQELPKNGRARILTSTHVDAIESRNVSRSEAADLIESRDLHVGDLVYLPRGTMHRGLGGAVVQVISVPGFVPKREIGLDHHLWAINRELGLVGDEALPFHLVAARTSVVK